jgi:hypothetical protein
MAGRVLCRDSSVRSCSGRRSLLFFRSSICDFCGWAVVLIVVLGFVEGVMVWLAVSIHRTVYILTDNELILKAPRLIGGNKRIPLETIESIQRTLIPFGVRLFGASFYGGYYYFPNVGKAFMVITNFKDGVLIKAQYGNYVTTPRKPEDFIESIKKMKTTATKT